MNDYIGAYKILCGVLNGGAYLHVEMKNLPEPRAFNTRLIYGVIERNISLDYIITRLCDKKPKAAIAVLIKMGVYVLRFMDEPDYAVINGIVETAKRIGKQGVAGFINAVLRRAKEVQLPQGSSPEDISIRCSYPLFAVKMLIEQYGLETSLAMLNSVPESKTHIRYNGLKTTKEEFEQLLDRLDCRVENSIYGYYVTHTTLDKLKEYDKLFTVQALGSMLVSNALTLNRGMKVLDVCAAPGGKSVYLYQLLNGDCSLTAQDIHPHRVELVNSYARRMGAKLNALVKDGTAIEESYRNGFDAVLLDAPCSGFGVARSKPDILLNRKQEDFAALCSVQRRLLEVSAKYVKVGGELVYSTCTIFRCENQDVVGDFLKNNQDFELVCPKLPLIPKHNLDIDALQFLDGIDDVEGFFIAKLRRVK